MREGRYMKYIFKMLLIAVMVVMCLVACGTTQKQKDIMEYISIDSVEMYKIESEALASYDSVTGPNFVDERTMYNEIKTNTINLARELNDMALNVEVELSDDEILEVHRIYVEFSDKLLSAMELMMSGIENQNVEEINQANATMNETNFLSIEYIKAVQDLAKEYNVELVNE